MTLWITYGILFHKSCKFKGTQEEMVAISSSLWVKTLSELLLLAFLSLLCPDKMKPVSFRDLEGIGGWEEFEFGGSAQELFLTLCSGHWSGSRDWISSGEFKASALTPVLPLWSMSLLSSLFQYRYLFMGNKKRLWLKYKLQSDGGKEGNCTQLL